MVRAVLWAGTVAMVLLAGDSWADGYRDFNAGAAALAREDYDAAFKSFSLAIGDADLPSHLKVSAYLARAELYDRQKQYDQSIADYTAAIAAKPDWPDPYLRRCKAFSEKDMNDKAMADCTAAVQLAPDDWRIRVARIVLYSKIRDYKDTVADYDRFIAARPEAGNFLLGRASVLQFMGEFDKSLADIEAAHALAPQWAAPYRTKAINYFAQGDFAKAYDADEDAIDADRRDASLRLTEGQLEWAMGKLDRAADSFETAIEKDPDYEYAFLWLSIVDFQRNKKVPDEFAQHFAALEKTSLPGELVQLYLGKEKPDALLKLHGQDDDLVDDLQCPVGFFVGEWNLMQGNQAEAKRLLSVAADACAANSTQRRFALVGLGRLP